VPCYLHRFDPLLCYHRDDRRLHKLGSKIAGYLLCIDGIVPAGLQAII
jgi:hypothetical protein